MRETSLNGVMRHRTDVCARVSVAFAERVRVIASRASADRASKAFTSGVRSE